MQAAGADALTASPYMGEDSLEPLLRDPSYGVFMLCRTSNPGAKDLQVLTPAPSLRCHSFSQGWGRISW
jgi:orotidine-5'-phosphate decarboxylase